jgi:hypothetical protein
VILFEHLAAPMALFVAVHHSGSQLAWLPRPALTGVWEFLLLLTSQGGILLVVVYLALCGFALTPTIGVGRSEPGKEKWAVRLLLWWLVLPPLLTLAATPIKPLFYARYMVMCVPALVLLAARGLVRLYDAPTAKRWAGTACFILVITLSGWGTYQYFVNFPAESTDWRSAVNYILEQQRPGDGVVIYTSHALCYRYYAHHSASQHQIATAPDVLYPPDPRRPVSHDELSSDTDGRERVWLVLHDEKEKPDELALVQSTLAEKLLPQEKRVFPGEIPITVVLYNRTPAEQ